MSLFFTSFLSSSLFFHSHYVCDYNKGGCYYYTINHSTIVAFTVGAKYIAGNGFKIIGAHTGTFLLPVYINDTTYLLSPPPYLSSHEMFSFFLHTQTLHF
jgi:hypothetical protein